MQDTDRSAPQFGALSLLFFCSGVSGLVYQVCWQRLLFAAFGSDLPSVTIIVSAFMAGLGLGALAGGRAADLWPRHAMHLFCGCELGIGLFGAASPGLLRGAGELFVAMPLAVVAGVNFVLVLLPALLMGATLPILVSYLARAWRHVGRATGQLYAINTLGAALGALAPTFWLLAHWPLSSVIRMAAALNLAVALAAWLLFRAQQARSQKAPA
ncbi:MAG TPA: fused MFS/spermidine synthase [Ideonella sp.]|nr:fused MFS/spermidine synthase [Ideonella sp.]